METGQPTSRTSKKLSLGFMQGLCGFWVISFYCRQISQSSSSVCFAHLAFLSWLLSCLLIPGCSQRDSRGAWKHDSWFFIPSLCIAQKLWCVCVCVHACMCWGQHMQLWACVWRSEVNVGCLSSLFSILCFWEGSLTEGSTCCFWSTAWSASPWRPPTPAPPPVRWGCLCPSLLTAFFVGAQDLNSGPCSLSKCLAPWASSAAPVVAFNNHVQSCQGQIIKAPLS